VATPIRLIASAAKAPHSSLSCIATAVLTIAGVATTVLAVTVLAVVGIATTAPGSPALAITDGGGIDIAIPNLVTGEVD